MKRWTIGTNNYYFTSSIVLEEAPWYIFMIGSSIQQICSWFPRISLPKIKIIRDNEETNLEEYYGTISDVFHIYICEPIFSWSYDKIKSTYIEFPYLMLKEKFPDIFNEYKTEFYDEDKDHLKENSEYSKKIGEEFKVVYDKLGKICDVGQHKKS